MPFFKPFIAAFLVLTFIAAPAMAEPPANATQILMQNGIDPAHPGGSAHLFQQQLADGTFAPAGGAPSQGNVKYRYKGADEDDLLYGVSMPQRVFNNLPRRRLR